jgi:hypothetical protein
MEQIIENVVDFAPGIANYYYHVGNLGIWYCSIIGYLFIRETQQRG